jgi:hypothetical protein
MPERVGIDETLRSVRGELEQLRGRLEALSGALWQCIDHEDPKALEAGVRFKQGYNERRAALDEAIGRMLALLVDHPASGPGRGSEKPMERAAAPEQVSRPPSPRPQLSAANLTLAGEMEQKLPFGFMLNGQTFTSASAWPLFYEALLQELYGRGPEQLSRLADPPVFEHGGRPLFARVPDRLDDPMPIADALFAEADLPAGALLEVIKRLMGEMGYPLESFKILLKEKNRGTVETRSLAA